MSIHRFQLDMTKEELESVERLGQLAALRTKKEVITNALTLLCWAAKEISYGRSICSVDESTGKVKHLELPALSKIAEAAAACPKLSIEERQAREEDLVDDRTQPPSLEKAI